MNATTCTWFNAMSMHVAELDRAMPRSIDWEQAMQALHIRAVCFAYHRAEYLKIEQEGISDRSSDVCDTSFIVAPIAQPAGVKLSMNAALAVAHLIAAAQSLRATCDCLFHIAYWAHNLHTESEAREVIPDRLQSHLRDRSKYEFDRLISSPEFKFLESFVHIASRQNIITVRRRKVGQPKLRRLELLIREFQCTSACGQITFPAKWANEFLSEDCEFIIESCNSLGKAIVSEMI